MRRLMWLTMAGIVLALGPAHAQTVKQRASSNHWIDDFYNWLDAQGLTKAR